MNAQEQLMALGYTEEHVTKCGNPKNKNVYWTLEEMLLLESFIGKTIAINDRKRKGKKFR